MRTGRRDDAEEKERYDEQAEDRGASRPRGLPRAAVRACG